MRIVMRWSAQPNYSSKGMNSVVAGPSRWFGTEGETAIQRSDRPTIRIEQLEEVEVMRNKEEGWVWRTLVRSV